MPAFFLIYAQRIAAKLHSGDVEGYTVIEAAEECLHGKPSEAIVPALEKDAYSGLVRSLTTFNETYYCDRQDEPLPPGC